MTATAATRRSAVVLRPSEASITEPEAEKLGRIVELLEQSRYDISLATDHRVAELPEGVRPQRHLRVLSSSSEHRLGWGARSLAVNGGIESSLSDRMAFLERHLELSEQDVFFLPSASLFELDQIFLYALTTPNSRPQIHVHIDHMLPSDIELAANRSWSTDALLSDLFRRFSLLGVLAADSLRLTSSREEIATRCRKAGITCRFLRWSVHDSDLPAAVAILHDEPFSPGSSETGAVAHESDQQPSESDVHHFGPIDDGPSGWSGSLGDFADSPIRFGTVLATPATAALAVSIPSIAEIWLGSAGPNDTVKSNGAPLSSTAEVLESTLRTGAIPMERPFVLHVAPAWAGEGSAHVFAAQLRYLKASGYGVLNVQAGTGHQEFLAFEDRLALLDALETDGAAHVWMLHRASPAERHLGLAEPYELPHLSFEGEERIARQLAVPPTLRAAIQHRDVRWALSNYGHLNPLVDALLPDKPFIVETHDVRPIQHALNNDTSVDESDIVLERQAWSKADGVVFLNEHERVDFCDAVGASNTATIYPPPAPAERPHDPYRTSVSNLLEAAATVADPTPARLLAERFYKASTSKKALFVGSAHRANISSLNWYLANVHYPYLHDEGVELVVAGSIASAFAGAALPGVTFLGRVPDLADVVDICDVTVLPITEGTGLPIKLLDAIDAKVPFVATPLAVRAIPELSEALPLFAEPAEFAAEVLSLLTKDDRRADFVDKTATIGEATISWDRYVTGWDAVVTKAGIDLPEADNPTATQPLGSKSAEKPIPIRPCGEKPELSADVGLETIEGNQYLTGGYGRVAVALGPNRTANPRALSVRLRNDSSTDTAIFWYANGVPWGRTQHDAESDVTVALPWASVPIGPYRVLVVEWSLSASAATKRDESGSGLRLENMSFLEATTNERVSQSKASR